MSGSWSGLLVDVERVGAELVVRRSDERTTGRDA
jgi:hypothetical protein